MKVGFWDCTYLKFYSALHLKCFKDIDFEKDASIILILYNPWLYFAIVRSVMEVLSRCRRANKTGVNEGVSLGNAKKFICLTAASLFNLFY